MRARSLSIRLLVLIVSLPLLLLFACRSPSRNPGLQVSVSGGLGIDPGRAAFESIALPQTGTLGDDPQVLAEEIYGTEDPVEDDYSEEVVTLISLDDEQVVQFSRMELPDDSVRGLRYRLEFVPQGEQWELTWVGQQVTCRPGRGHEDWGTAPCR